MNNKKLDGDESSSVTQQRQIENESVFRKANEKFKQDLDSFSSLARDEGAADLAPQKDMIVYFYCECADENCHERIAMSIGEYETIHDDRHNFIVTPGHVSPAIEEVKQKHSRFSLVKKFLRPPEKDVSLNPTPTNNV